MMEYNIIQWLWNNRKKYIQVHGNILDEAEVQYLIQVLQSLKYKNTGFIDNCKIINLVRKYKEQDLTPQETAKRIDKSIQIIKGEL